MTCQIKLSDMATLSVRLFLLLAPDLRRSWVSWRSIHVAPLLTFIVVVVQCLLVCVATAASMDLVYYI
jgi:hypothetical protein